MRTGLVHQKKLQAGFTLIELLLYIAIVGSLLTSITYFFGLAAEARIKNQSVSEVDEQATAAMDYMTQTIRNATSITSPAAGASASALTIVVPTGSLSPTIMSVNGTTLQTQEGAAAAIPLTNSKVQITNVTFKNLTKPGTAGIVQISFTLARTNTASRNEYDFQKTFTTSAEIGW